MVTNIKKKYIFLMILLVLINVNYVLAETYTTCDTHFNTPTVLYNQNGNEKMSYDSSGNILFFENPKQSNSLKLGTYQNDKINNVHDRQSTIPNSDGLLFKNPSGIRTILFGKNKNVYTKGYAVYDDGGSKSVQAGCADDGWRNDFTNNNLASASTPQGWYCNGANNNIREDRNYFCSITGNLKNGQCKYDVVNTEDCSTRPSVKYGGNSPLTRGYLRDYLTCKRTGGNIENGCSYQETAYDVCSDSWTLHELKGGTSGVDYTSKNCNDYSGNLYCSGLNVYKTIFGCSGGTCNDGAKSDSYQESCSFPTYYTCSGNNKVTHTPKCSGGSCGENTYSSNCGSTYCYSSHTESSSYSCNPYSCNYHSCNPHDCNCQTVDDVTTCSTCSDTCHDTCYNTCYNYWNVCDEYMNRGCSGGSCYAYIS